MARPGETAGAGGVRRPTRPLGRVVVPNFGWRYSGVTSVIRATFPHLQRATDADLVGLPAGAIRTTRSAAAALAGGFAAPVGYRSRVWHARRNVEMLVGLFLRSVLRWRLRVVFTWAGQRRYTRYTGWLIDRVDAVIATSDRAAAFVHRPTVIIPHGIDGDVYHPAPDREAAWRTAGLGGRHGIGVFGRVRHQKGTDLFVEALVQLLPRYPDFTGIVVGLCKPTEAAFLAGLRAQVKAAGLTDRVHFLGEVAADDLPRWLAAVSICVAPQRHEGFGLVPLEAAACGTPVIAARSGAADLIVDHETTGLVAEAGDLPALTAAIERLMADAALRTRMGEAARSRAIERFGIAREVAAYLDVYRTLWGR